MSMCASAGGVHVLMQGGGGAVYTDDEVCMCGCLTVRREVHCLLRGS